MRVVFDTNTVVSALLFANGRPAWLRAHWPVQDVVVLASRDTVDALIRVLSYPKFKLEQPEIEALLADYLPFTELVPVRAGLPAPRCADEDDQIFVELAVQGKADVLVSGDRDLLAMELGLAVVTPAHYQQLARH